MRFNTCEFSYGRSIEKKHGEWLFSVGVSAVNFTLRGKYLYSYGSNGTFFSESTNIYETERITYLGIPIEAKYIITENKKSRLNTYLGVFVNINNGKTIYVCNTGLLFRLN